MRKGAPDYGRIVNARATLRGCAIVSRTAAHPVRRHCRSDDRYIAPTLIDVPTWIRRVCARAVRPALAHRHVTTRGKRRCPSSASHPSRWHRICSARTSAARRRCGAAFALAAGASTTPSCTFVNPTRRLAASGPSGLGHYHGHGFTFSAYKEHAGRGLTRIRSSRCHTRRTGWHGKAG